MSAGNEIRDLGVDDYTFERLETYYDEADQREKLAVSRGLLTHLAIDMASDWLRGHNYDLDKGSPQFRDFALKFIKARVIATKAIKLRQEGTLSDTPPAPAKVSTINSDSDSLEKLRDYWLTQGKKSRTAEAEANTMWTSPASINVY